MIRDEHLHWPVKMLVEGYGRGQALVLDEPLSLWGGLDPQTGKIIDERHPSFGKDVTDKVMLLPFGRGSSSASSILLESVRVGTAPAAIITAEPDSILALGAIVSLTLYNRAPPVVVLDPQGYRSLCHLIAEQVEVRLEVTNGLVRVL